MPKKCPWLGTRYPQSIRHALSWKNVRPMASLILDESRGPDRSEMAKMIQESDSEATTSAPMMDETREWRIYTFLVSILALALAAEVLGLRQLFG